MKNYLVITLGTSEVQVIEDKLEANGFSIAADKKSIFSKETPNALLPIKENRNRTGTYLFDKPRIGGEFVIQSGLEKYMPIFGFPLVLPAIELFFKENTDKQIDKCLLVFTDQTDPKFRDTDTLHFKTILKGKLKETYEFKEDIFMEFPIRENVTVIDYQYVDFAKKCREILETPEEEIEQVVLLTQGGIDQINQALTLQFIQAYKHKLKLYQKAEGRPPEVLNFPQLFLRDLNKQKIIKHLEDYDFDKASLLILDDMSIKSKLDTATKRLNMTYHGLFIQEHHKMWEELSVIEQNRIKIQDITYSFKIQMRQAKYNDALTKLYTLYENLFKQIVNEFTNTNTSSFFKKNIKSGQFNAEWEGFINGLNSKFLSQLKTKKVGKYPLDLSNPNTFTYYYLLCFLAQEGGHFEETKIKKIDMVLQKLREKRNEINHAMGAVLKSEIDNIFINQKITEQQFYDLIDDFAETKGMGYYEQLRQECLKFYL